MEIIFRVIIITGACCLSAKHVFIQDGLSWTDARTYCKTNHTNLSPLTSQLEEQVFRDMVGEEGIGGWIGLYWDQEFRRWKWSDGDNVTYVNNLVLPDIDGSSTPPYRAENVRWTRNQWEWKSGTDLRRFFCLNLTVVQEKKTWEEALELCSKNNSNFTSLLSETENLLATDEINQTSVTEQVWIGLRYLGDSWLWVNGDPLVYQAWSQRGDQNQLCPMMRSCGALTKNGAWESRGCQEKLHFICS